MARTTRAIDSAARSRSRLAAWDAEDRAALWCFTRAVARVAAVDAVLADYATSICGRPVRRRDVGPLESAVSLPGVTWSIDGEVLVEFLPGDSGPGELIVYEIALLKPLKKQFRSRHFRIKYAATRVREP
jgi:hypothetical protein